MRAFATVVSVTLTLAATAPARVVSLGGEPPAASPEYDVPAGATDETVLADVRDYFDERSYAWALAAANALAERRPESAARAEGDYYRLRCLMQLSRFDERSFYWAREAAVNSREVDLAVCLSLCATRDFITPENLWKYVYLAKEWGAGFVRILEPRKVGRFEGEGVELEEEHVDVLTGFYQTVNADPACRELPIVTYPGYGQRRVGCYGAGNRYLYVDSNGDLHACPFCQRKVGNALVDSLDEAVAKMKKIGCRKFETNAWA